MLKMWIRLIPGSHEYNIVIDCYKLTIYYTAYILI